MSVLVLFNWPEVNREQYEQVRAQVDWMNMRPNGANLHISAFDEAGGLHVVDHWDSAEQFQAFIDAQIAPAAQAAGISGQPQVQIYPIAYVDEFDKLGT
jgi:hypothetical protein